MLSCINRSPTKGRHCCLHIRLFLCFFSNVNNPLLWDQHNLLRTNTYTVYLIFLPSSLQCAVLQADRSHRRHGPLPVSGDRPRPILQPGDGGWSRGNRENLSGGEHTNQAGPQGVQLPDRQHVCSGMSTCQVRRHVHSSMLKCLLRYVKMSAQVHQHFRSGILKCLLRYVKMSAQVC